MSNGTAKAELEGGRRDSERLGRRVGIALFWLLLCYVIGMSALSIIPALFWPSLAPLARRPGVAHCAREISALDEQLLSKLGASIQRGEVASLESWLMAWDKRYAALSGGCESLDGARRDLLELRNGAVALLADFGEGPLEAHRRLRSALGPFRGDSAPNDSAPNTHTRFAK